MRIHIIAISAIALIGSARAVELFPDGKIGPTPKGASVSAADTIGGYALYAGDEKWQFDDGKTDLVIGPSTIPMGTAKLAHRDAGSLVAAQIIRANLAPRANGAMWRGGPCTQDSFYKRVGRNGAGETCVIVEPQAFNLGNRPVTFFSILIEETGYNGKYFLIDLKLNTEMFGFLNTSIDDWKDQGLSASQPRRIFVDKLIGWTTILWKAVDQAFLDKEKGAEYMRSVPSYLTLRTVPLELQDKGYSLSFIGAVLDLDNRLPFSAIAYSPTAPGVTRWANATNQPTQSDADVRAIANCERERAPSRPPCMIYKKTPE
ncbi:MAG: hypothetical protein AB9M53_09205 [Leptothrix sp. (in: b-proteobacteria)]